MWRNTPQSFGRLTRLLHWSMAAAILLLLLVGYLLTHMQPSLSTLWLYGLHKTLGLLALALALLRLIWHRISPPPAPLGPPGWESRAARAAHVTLYILMLAVPVTGWIGSAATGLDVVIFGQFTLPAIAPTSEAWETTAFALHSAATKALMAVLLAHIGGASLRGIRQDGSLRRMLSGSKQDVGDGKHRL